MEMFTVLLIAYMVKIAAEDTWHGVRGTPNPRNAARARRQRARAKSRTWNALTNYWADLVEDATQAATERRRRKAAERRQQGEEKPDEEIQEAEWWEEDEPHQDPWERSVPVTDPPSTPREQRSDATSPAAEPDRGMPLANQCPGCIGRGMGTGCCMCGLPIPESLRRKPGDPSEFKPGDSNVYPFPNRIKESNVSEIQGLDQAIEYARSLADKAAEHGAAGNEGYIGVLTERNVSGATLASAHAMQEAFANAAAAAEAHAQDLEEGKVVQEAYDQAPDSGDQEFAQAGR